MSIGRGGDITHLCTLKDFASPHTPCYILQLKKTFTFLQSSSENLHSIKRIVGCFHTSSLFSYTLKGEIPPLRLSVPILAFRAQFRKISGFASSSVTSLSHLKFLNKDLNHFFCLFLSYFSVSS